MSKKKVFTEKSFLEQLENVGALKDTKAKNVSQRSLVKVRNVSIGLVLAAFSLDSFSDQEVLKWIRKGRKLTDILSDQFMLYRNLAKYLINDTNLKDIEEWKAVLDSPYVWPTKGGEDDWCKLFGHVPNHCKDILGVLRLGVASSNLSESPDQMKVMEQIIEDGDGSEVPIASQMEMEAKSEFSIKVPLDLMDTENKNGLEGIREKEDSTILNPEPDKAITKPETVENIHKIESPQGIVIENILLNEDPELLGEEESFTLNKRLHEEINSNLKESEEPKSKRVKHLREMKIRGNKYTIARQKQIFNYKKKLKYAIKILNGYSKCKAKTRHTKVNHESYNNAIKDRKSINSNLFMKIIQNKQDSKKRKKKFQSPRKGNKRICEENIAATKKNNSQMLFLEMDNKFENPESNEDEMFIIGLPNYTSIKSENNSEILSNNGEECQDFWAPMISDSDDNNDDNDDNNDDDDNDFNDTEGDSDDNDYDNDFKDTIEGIVFENDNNNSNLTDNAQDEDNINNMKNCDDNSNNNYNDGDNTDYHQKIEKLKEESIEKYMNIIINKNYQGKDFTEDDKSQNTFYETKQNVCNNAEVKITNDYYDMKEIEIVEEKVSNQHNKENKDIDNLPNEEKNTNSISTINYEQRISEIKRINNITEMVSHNDTASVPEINNTHISKLDNNLQNQKCNLKDETINNFTSKEYDLIFMKAKDINNVNDSINDSGIDIVDHKDLTIENEPNRNDNCSIDNEQETTIRKEPENKPQVIRIESKQEINTIIGSEIIQVPATKKEPEIKNEAIIIKESETADDIINALLSQIQQSKSILETEISNDENVSKTVAVTSETEITEESLIIVPNESVVQKSTADVPLLNDEVAGEAYVDNKKNKSLELMEIDYKSFKLNEKKDEEEDEKNQTKAEVYEAEVAVRRSKSKTSSDKTQKKEKISLGRCSKKEGKQSRSKSEKKIRKTLDTSEKESVMSNDDCKNKELSHNQSLRNDVTKFQISSFIENIRCSNEFEKDYNKRTVDKSPIKYKNDERKKRSVFKRMGSKDSEIDKPVNNIQVKTRAGRRAAAEAEKLIVKAPAADLIAFKGGYRCEICRNNYQDKDIHLANPRHQKNRNIQIRKLIEQEDCLVLQHSSGNIKCLWCNVLLIGPENSKEHLNDPKHKEAIKEASSENDFSLVKKDKGGYWCKICWQVLQDKAKHLADPRHKAKAILKNTVQPELLKKLIKEEACLQQCLTGEIECIWCNLKMSDLGIVKRHLNGVQHRSAEKMDTRKAPSNNSAAESSTKSVNEENRSQENEQIDDLNNCKITIVSAATLTSGLTEDKKKPESAYSKIGALSNENKGFKMLAALGWKEGEGLGKDKEGRLEPEIQDIQEIFVATLIPLDLVQGRATHTKHDPM